MEEAEQEARRLREQVAGLEASRTYMEDTQRWVEGASDQEPKEEPGSKLDYRSVNTVVISCNTEAEARRSRRPRFPARGRSKARVIVAMTPETSEESDKSSYSEKQEKEDKEKVVEQEVELLVEEHQVNHLQAQQQPANMVSRWRCSGEEVRSQSLVHRPEERRPGGLHGTPSATTTTTTTTALSRCKSFFGLRRPEGEEELLRVDGAEDSFVLKGDSGSPSQRSQNVKRSKSMDILRSRMLRRPTRRELEEPPVLVLDKGDPYRNRNEYVSKWAKEAFFSDNMYSEELSERREPLPQPTLFPSKPPNTFYSLYFPADPTSRTHPLAEEGQYLSMNNNLLKDRSANTNAPRSKAKYESEFY